MGGNPMLKTSALVSSSLLALVGTQPVFAQDAPAAPQGQQQQEQKTQSDQARQANPPAAANDGIREGEIVVTATKIATNVQDVPIAITAVTSDQLKARQITEFKNLGDIVPNATFRKEEGIYGAGVSVTLRGIGQTDTQFSGEPAVAYYIDDVYYPFLFGSNFDLLDLDHVEVLRGPQGTLFGRNAISGAVNLVSKKPQFDDISAYVELTTGSRNRLDARAGINIPLAQNLAVSASMVSKKQTGYMRILDFSCQMYKDGTPELAGKFPFQAAATSYAAGKTPKSCVVGHLGGTDARAARAALRWEPAPGIELNISGDYARSDNESAAEKVFEVDYSLTYGALRGVDAAGGRWGPYTGVVDESTANKNFITMFDQFSLPGHPFRYDQRFETDSIYTTYDNFCDPFPAGTMIAGNTYYNGSMFRGGRGCDKRTVPLETWGGSAKLTAKLDSHLELAAIGGYREMTTEFGAAWDGTPLADSIIFHRDSTWNWNGEVRLTGRYHWLDFSAGGFYYKGYADETGLPQNVRLGTQQYQYVYYYPKAKAAYLNVTVRPSFLPDVSLNGGIRRSEDSKFVDYSAMQDASAPGSPVFTPAASSTYFTLPIHNKRWDWKLGADWHITDDIMVYGLAATGYRLPGFQTRVFQVGQIQQQYPTALINYEVGFKMDLFNRHLRLNGAAFWLAYSMRNASFGGQEARYDPNNPVLTILPGNQTLITDGPAGTSYSSSFSNCRNYDAATDGPANGKTTGISCISRTWNYPISGGDPVRGVELEATAEPIKDLLINYSFGYTDRGASTGRPIGFPDFTMSGGIQYHVEAPALDGVFTPRLDWFWISKVAWSTNYPELDDPARSTFNARLTYYNRGLDYEVAVGVTNLTNQKYFLQKTIFIQGLGAGANIGQPSEPRSWYLSVSKRF
jgi:iron complex outermembrane receptor protein